MRSPHTTLVGTITSFIPSFFNCRLFLIPLGSDLSGPRPLSAPHLTLMGSSLVSSSEDDSDTLENGATSRQYLCVLGNLMMSDSVI